MDIKNHVNYQTFTSLAAERGNNKIAADFPFFGVTKNSSAEQILEGLNSIENTLSKLSLTFRVYDFYNIQQTISQQDECNAKINALINNSAAIINSNNSISTDLDGQPVVLTRGDVVYKDNAGDLQLIKGSSGGWYKPVDGSDKGKITFKYTRTDTDDVVINTNSVETTGIYGLYGTLVVGDSGTTVSPNKLVRDSEKHIIFPLIKNYFLDDSTSNVQDLYGEEMCIDEPFFIRSYDENANTFSLKYNYCSNLVVAYAIK